MIANAARARQRSTRPVAPPVTIDVSYLGARVPLARERIVRLAAFVLREERVHAAVISFAFVSTPRIAALHRTYQGDATPTDIVTLQHRVPVGDGAAAVADIFIAPHEARQNVKRFGGTLREEIARLVVHGTLHALGHTHPDDDRRVRSPMWKRQERILRDAASEGIW